MGQAHLPRSAQRRLDGSPSGCSDDIDDEHTDEVVSVLEENARLRRLVTELSELVLRNVLDRS